MGDERGQLWLGILLFCVILLAILGPYLFFVFEDKGYFDKKDVKNLTQGSNNNSIIGSSESCVLTNARWEKDGFEVSSAIFGEQVHMVADGLNCKDKDVVFRVYRYDESKDVLIDSFNSLFGNDASHVFNIDSDVVNASYYFVASLNSGNSTRSDLLDVGNSIGYFRDPLLCNGYGDDRDFLYDVDTNIFSKSNGKESFIITLDGKTLRTNNTGEDRFFVDNSNGALQINYDIREECGGVDIVYDVNNPTSQSQLLPDFLFSGFTQERTSPKYVDLLRGGTVMSAEGKNALYASYYPSSFVYSPVTFAINDEISQSSSIQYPFLDYRVETIPQMTWANDGNINYRYVLVYSSNSGPTKGTISSGNRQTYTISLRFAPARNWLLTLHSYKKYFASEYSLESSKDNRPVAGISEAYTSYVSSSNPRGYVDWYNGNLLNDVGWSQEVSRIIGIMNDKGYKRLMLWNTAGLYDPAICASCNFPPAFMDWLPKMVETQSELNRIKQAGISLGYWWGRSGQIPVPDHWPPNSVVPADYFNQEHKSFLSSQFDLAKQRGANMVGLDSFGAMEPYGRSEWLDEMHSSSIEFIHEHGGADIFHNRAANFYTDEYENGNWQTISGPSLLSWYINPNSEIWAYEVASNSELDSLGQSGMRARAEQLAKWGYTYVDNGAFLDVDGLDLSISECLDGIDNNNDGLIDWPRDFSCENEFDLAE